MEAAREHPETVGTPQDFMFKALQARRPPSLSVPCGIACVAATLGLPRCLRPPFEFWQENGKLMIYPTP